VKNELASAVQSKGGTVNDTDSFDAMVSAVDGIPLGNNYASGTIISSSDTHSFELSDITSSGNNLYVCVTGLDFSPRTIL
jgi:hypothetical protein